VKFRIEEDARINHKKNNISRRNGMTKQIADGILHKVPQDMEKVLASNTQLLSLWNNLTPIQRNEWICWVTIVKKAETREDHIERMVEELNDGKRQPCCWPGCPHRRPKAKKWFK
jgi:uncharacterized protein YdeI (YjbR/CyaY-like superfamily)